jgi:hypothetical protein
MKFLELFSGTKTMSKTFEAQGFEVFSIDINPDLLPSLVADILTVDTPLILQEFGRPDVIWASPDCRKFSFASGGRNEFRAANNEPLSEDALEAIELVKHTLLLIEELEPTYWFLENPDHGALKKLKFMKKYPSETVAYCAYGMPYQKMTKIWGRFPPSFNPKSHCGHFKHEVENIKLFKDAKARSEVPFRLAYDLARAVKKDNGKQLVSLRDYYE